MTLVPRHTRRPLAAALAALVAAGVAVLAITGAAGAVDEPAGPLTGQSDSASADPTSTEPASTEPASTEPSSTEPTSIEPTSTEPSSTEPTSTGASTEPTDTESPTETPDPTPTADPDDSPPVIVSTVVGQLGGGNWYVGDVRVTWSVADDESKVTSATGCAEVLVTEDTAALTLVCTAASEGGSANSPALVINRDATPPTIACPAGAQRVQGSSGATLEAAVADSGSGPAAPIVSVAVPTDALGTVQLSLGASDIAGNQATALCAVDVIPDTSAPLIGDPSIDGKVGLNGWFTGDVTVSFPVSEPESTLLSTVGCGPEVVTADSAGAVVTCTATSDGGTSSRAATIARDATGPVISCPTPPSIVQGTARTLTAAVSDAVSGPATLTVSSLLSSSVLGAATVALPASDLAGNGSTAVCEYLVVADPTPPVIAASILGPAGSSPSIGGLAQSASGSPWYTGPVTVSFAISEDDSVLLGQSGCDPIEIAADTAGQVVDCTATSYGGQQTRSVIVALDTTAPVVTCSATPVYVQGSAGTVSATFSDATSGPTSLGATADVDTRSLGQGALSIATRDAAGNPGSSDCPFLVVPDDTKPVIVPTIDGLSRAPGWYTGPVTVSFAVSDPDSPWTAEGCDPVVVSADVVAQTVAVCRATSYGGIATNTVVISRDSVAPVLTCLSLRFVQGIAGKATANATDETSGVASESVTQTADTSTPGRRAVTLTSTDRAGNMSSERCTYEVVERKTVSATKLSSTGSDIAPMVLGGFVLALAGTLLAIVARRRAHSRSRHSAS